MLARRNLAHVRQIPEKLLDVTLQPIMFVLLFAFVFGGVIAVPDGSYREYLIGGILVQTLAFGMMGPATSIATDLQEGVVDRFRTLPMARSAYLLGHILAELGAGADRRSRARVTGLIVGWRIHSDLPHALAGYGLLLLFASRCCGRDAARPRRALARRGAGRRVHGRVPADVPRHHVRAARRAAGVLADRGVEPDQRARRRGAELFGNPTATPADAAWPLATPCSSRAVVRRDPRGHGAAGAARFRCGRPARPVSVSRTRCLRTSEPLGVPVAPAGIGLEHAGGATSASSAGSSAG